MTKITWLDDVTEDRRFYLIKEHTRHGSHYTVQWHLREYSEDGLTSKQIGIWGLKRDAKKAAQCVVDGKELPPDWI